MFLFGYFFIANSLNRNQENVKEHSFMVFLKSLEKLELEDVEKLKLGEVCESQILDYKEQLLDDNKLLEEVSAFANTQGGFLIFGVKETGRGGYPQEILGISKSQINKERMEQIILGNIQPRLNVKIKEIEHQDPSKAIIVVQVPNSYLKPHMHGRYNKFYKRYEFEALPMTEIEVSDAYRRRFAGYQEVKSYISMLLGKREFMTITPPPIIGQIVVIPTIINRMIDTSSAKEFDWMMNLDLMPKYDIYMPSHPTPSSNGIKCQFLDKNEIVRIRLEVHRNGCIHYFSYFGESYQEKMLFLYHIFCVKLLYTLQFASTLYQRYNYYGDVNVTCNLLGTKNSWLPSFGIFSELRGSSPSQVDSINISREYSTNVVQSKYECITSGIMDDIFNSYGLWKCPLFDDEGNLKESMLRS